MFSNADCWISLIFALLLVAFETVNTAKHHGKSWMLCREPPDLHWRLFRWFTETSENETFELPEDDWTVPVSESKICETIPANDVNSSLMERSLCPWMWKLSHDENREPKMLAEAHCLCRRSRGNSISMCLPIRRKVAVLKRTRCNLSTGLYEYARATQTVIVGCHSALPRSRKAGPLTDHYKKVIPLGRGI